VKPAPPKGVYLWGAVGRGKSFLMDSFYLCVPLVRKRRVHFHHFMREIHREMNELKETEDPLVAVAGRTARRYRLICFDEFHVADIGDAMILGRYLEKVMDLGVQFVMTSNYHPDQLYPNGLQRERFLPAIELLKSRLDVVNVDGGKDYRRLKMEKLRVYHVGKPGGPDIEGEMARIFQELKDVEEEKHPLDVEGRVIPYRKRAGGLVWFDFAVLCGGPRSYADYVDLARRFHTVILSGVPKMSPKNADSADGGDAKTAAAEFARTASRLTEMQSAAYLQAERRMDSGKIQGVSP
jgi:cell division protein ZapE